LFQMYSHTGCSFQVNSSFYSFILLI